MYKRQDDTYTVTAMRETLIKSNLGALRAGDLVNLERSMKPDALLDGHIAVSYTHLDVYKRQVRTMTVEELAAALR